MKSDNLITNRQFISLASAFFLGNALAVTGGINASEKTGHITILISFILYTLLCFIYKRIFTKCETSDIFGICVQFFGVAFEKLIYVAVFIYSIFTAVISSVEFLFFVEASSDFSLNPLLISFIFAVAVFLILLCGKKALARYSELILPFVLGIIAFVFIFGVKKMNFQNLIPSNFPKISELSKEVSISFLSPFSNILLIYFFVSDMFTKKTIQKGSICAGLISLAVIMAVYIANLTVIGKNLMNSLYFPALYTFSVINPEIFTERSETVFFTTYIFLDILYTACAYFVATDLCGRIFSKKNTPPKKIRKVFLVIPSLLSFAVMALAPDIETFRSSLKTVPFILSVITLGIPVIFYVLSLFRDNLPHKTKNNPLQ